MIEINLIAFVCLELIFIGVFFYTLYLRGVIKHSKQELLTFTETIEHNLNKEEKRLLFTHKKGEHANLVFQINALLSAYHLECATKQKTDRERKKLFSDLSHDVRTPLASIIGYLEAIRLGYAQEDTQAYLQVAEEKAHVLKNYLDGLFTMAQLDSGQLDLELSQHDLNECLREELISFVPLLQAKEIQLAIEIEDRPLWVEINREALTRIFNNLMQNALKHGKDTSFIGIKAWEENGGAYFEIWDRGAGIQESDLPFVFERLYRGDASRSTSGSGLGLSIVKELVTKQGGKITMHSKPYVRTGAIIFLPKKTCQTL